MDDLLLNTAFPGRARAPCEAFGQSLNELTVAVRSGDLQIIIV